MIDTSQATTPNPPGAEKNFKRLLRLFSSYKGTIAAAVVAGAEDQQKDDDPPPAVAEGAESGLITRHNKTS